MIIVLDTGPLGMVTHPRASGENQECGDWLRGLLEAGHHIVVPEICDYELRRELVRADKQEGLRRLDDLGNALRYLPITTAVMNRAAHLWASARNEGQPTASRDALDGDVILAAQTLSLVSGDEIPIVATTTSAI